MVFVYLIQHENGYVHCVFKTIQAARLWIARYNSVSSTPDAYTIIQREFYNHPEEIN